MTAAIQCFLSHNSARYIQAVTADSMSCTATHSSGPCALCSPQNRFGVGRPSSVRREPIGPATDDVIIGFESRHPERFARQLNRAHVLAQPVSHVAILFAELKADARPRFASL